MVTETESQLLGTLGVVSTQSSAFDFLLFLQFWYLRINSGTLEGDFRPWYSILCLFESNFAIYESIFGALRVDFGSQTVSLGSLEVLFQLQ